jgi:hypothetical protein
MSPMTFSRQLGRMVDEIYSKKDLPSSVDKAQVASLLVSVLHGFKAPLPSMEVEQPIDNWFINNCLPTIENELVALNEYYIIDVVNSLRLIQKIWRVRYNMLHVATSLQAVYGLVATLGSSGHDGLAPVYKDILQLVDVPTLQQKLLDLSVAQKGSE